MKKRILITLCAITVAMSLTACGQAAANEGTGSIVNSSEPETQQEKEKETLQDRKEEKEVELPYWKGVRDNFGYRVDFADGRVGIEIEYPSLKPASYGWAYQTDATFVGVLYPGYDEEFNDLQVDTLENTFTIAKAHICKKLDDDRSRHYDNFDFVVETEEQVTINGLSMYKYTGIHTYTYDEEERECDFVAYSVDTGQIEHTYPIIIVIDDTLSNPSMDPVPEGTIEAYARKMAESITVDE